MRNIMGSAGQTGFKLWLETQVWFEDEKRTKHNVLSPFLISNTHSQRSADLAAVRAENKADALRVFFSRLRSRSYVNYTSLFHPLD